MEQTLFWSEVYMKMGNAKHLYHFIYNIFLVVALRLWCLNYVSGLILAMVSTIVNQLKTANVVTNDRWPVYDNSAQ